MYYICYVLYVYRYFIDKNYTFLPPRTTFTSLGGIIAPTENVCSNLPAFGTSSPFCPLHSPSFCSSNMPILYRPQNLCTSYSLCLEQYAPWSSHGWLLTVSFSMSSPQESLSWPPNLNPSIISPCFDSLHCTHCSWYVTIQSLLSVSPKWTWKPPQIRTLPVLLSSGI